MADFEDSAGATAVSYTNEFLDGAVAKLDATYGHGYAKANPALVAAYLSCCGANLASFIQSALALPDLNELEGLSEEMASLFSEPKKKKKGR